jgi:hypothetical protein
MSSRRVNNANNNKNINNNANNNKNNNNINNKNNNNENDHYINNGVDVHVRYIPKVGHSKPVPPRGQKSHRESLKARIARYLGYKWGKIQHIRNTRRKKQERLNAYAQVKTARRSRMPLTRRGPKGAKGRN